MMVKSWEWVDFDLTSRSYARSVVKMLNQKKSEYIFKTKKATSDDGKGNWWGMMRMRR